MCVPAARLSAALGALPDGQFASKVGDGRLTLTVGGQADHPTLPVQDFPDDRAANANEWSPAGEIQQHIADVSVAAANQDVRYHQTRSISIAIRHEPLSRRRTGIGLASHQRRRAALEVLVPRDAFKSIAACNWTESAWPATSLSCAVLEWC